MWILNEQARIYTLIAIVVYLFFTKEEASLIQKLRMNIDLGVILNVIQTLCINGLLFLGPLIQFYNVRKYS